MSRIIERIDAYKVIFAVQVHGYYHTYIDLYSEAGTLVGILSFYDGDAPSECIRVEGGRFVEMWFPRSHFEDIATLLRVEQPVYLHVREFDTYAYLSTNREPEGEEEMARRGVVHARP